DGNDADNRGKAVYDDATGRFIPYVMREGERIRLFPVQHYENEGTGDFYQVPKRTKRFSVIEPYAYELDGEDVLMTSLVLPILDGQNRFLGIVGADISLSSVQENIEDLRPLGGHANMIT